MDFTSARVTDFKLFQLRYIYFGLGLITIDAYFVFISSTYFLCLDKILNVSDC